MVDYRANRGNRDFKKGLDAEKGRRNRNDTRLQLRKSKKEEGLQKRRAMANTQVEAAVPEVEDSNRNVAAVPSIQTYTSADIPSLAETFRKVNATTEDILNAVTGFRKLLSVEKNPPVQEVISANVLPNFIQLLMHPDPKVQFEAAWALTNVASTEFTRTVAQYGAIPNLVQLLLSGNPDVREQSAWCLGNIAGDATDLRDMVLEAGALEPMLKNVAEPANKGLLNNVVWAISNLCRGKPQPNLALVEPAVPHLAKLIHENNSPAVMDACWAISYISDGDDARIDAVMNTGVTPALIKLLGSSNSSIVTPALRALGNFVSGNERQTQGVVDAGVIECAQMLLEHPKRSVRKETCWLLSNIAAGNTEQISSIIRKPQTIRAVLGLVERAEWEVRKEATWVISNICTGGQTNHVHDIVELGAINALCSVIDAADPKILMIVLDAIESILRVGKLSSRDYVGYVDECDGLDKIESLQEHENDAVYKKTVGIIETYFGVEDGEDENLVPEINGDQFAFGLPVSKTLETGDMMQQHEQQPLQPFNF